MAYWVATAPPEQQIDECLITGTRPHGARHHADHRHQSVHEFQCTRPHGARPFPDCAKDCPAIVSIHAPARGATLLPSRAGRIAGFNPRARTGRDPVRPTRCLCWQSFQSTRPHGARLRLRDHTNRAREFQSTRPHGARPWRGRSSSGCCSFNPRARTGRDVDKVLDQLQGEVSIHAPARGATRLL